MPRPLQRVRLESGLQLDLNWLIRRRAIVPRCKFQRPRCIAWTNSYTGEEIATGEIMFDLEGTEQGWLLHQDWQSRGRQWYFVCHYTNRRASVLWMPPGAHSFACRQKWGRQVAYGSQFSTRVDRAHQGHARIKRPVALN
jgi:hypothetical protein